MRKLQGGIDTTTNGRFRLRLRKKTVGIYDSWEEAEATRLASLEILEAEQGPGGSTLGVFGKRVLTARETGKQIRDPQSDWGRWNTHVADDVIAKINVRALRTDHLEAWLERIEKRGLAPQTRRNCLNVVRVVLRAAVKQRLARSNVAIGIRVEGKSASAWTYLTPDEQRALVAATPAPEQPIVAFAIGTGLRAGELVSLHLADVHVDGPEPHILVRFGKKGRLPTKTGSGLRAVPLFGLALDAARAWLVALPSYASENPRGLMFPTRTGCLRDDRHVLPWAIWKGRGGVPGVLARAGIMRPFRWHDLRHTCASSLASGWWGRRWALEEIKGFLGHSTIAVTQRYAHLAPSAVTLAAMATRGGVAKVSFAAQPADLPMVSGGFEDRGPHQSATRLREAVSRLLPASCKTDGARPFDRRDTALALLRAVALGEDADAAELAGALAASVLTSTEVDLALAVTEGGALAVTRAIDLAERVLDADGSERRRSAS